VEEVMQISAPCLLALEAEHLSRSQIEPDDTLVTVGGDDPVAGHVDDSLVEPIEVEKLTLFFAKSLLEVTTCLALRRSVSRTTLFRCHELRGDA
jgi:hypothetical protein